MNTLSICIPTYEMNGQGSLFLRQSFDVLAQQTFKDFDVVISDHSQDTAIEHLCREYGQTLEIHYYKNIHNRGSSSANINNAINYATGRLIKILFQDDFLYHEKALAEIVEAFDIEKDHWLITACIHSTDGTTFFKPFYPHHHTIQHIWIKTVFSSPSTLTIKNDHPLLFDEQLVWHMDSDYYRHCYDTFGEPNILNTINVVNRVGAHQVTATMATRALRKKEYLIMLQRYERGAAFCYYRTIGQIKDIVKYLIDTI